MSQKVLVMMNQNSLPAGDNGGYYCLRHYTNMLKRLGYDVHRYIFPQAAAESTVTNDGLVNTIADVYGTVIADYDFALIPYVNTFEMAAGDAIHDYMTEGVGASTPIFTVGGISNGSDYVDLGFNNTWDTPFTVYVYTWKGVEFPAYGFQGDPNTGFAYASTWEALISPTGTVNSPTAGYVRTSRFQGANGWVYSDLSSMRSSPDTMFPMMLQEAIDAGHVPKPERRLMVALDIDDFPSPTLPSTLADVQALYALQEEYGVPITYGMVADKMEDNPAGANAYIEARTPANGGLIHPIDHGTDAVAQWNDDTKANITGQHTVYIDKMRNAGVTSGTVTYNDVVTNGDFVTDVTGWTVTGGALTWVAGAMLVTQTSAWGKARQALTLVPGQQYGVTVDVTEGTATAYAIKVNGSTVVSGTVSGTETVFGWFTATLTSENLDLLVNDATGSLTLTFDNVRVFAATSDNWGYRFFFNNEVGSVGAVAAAERGINVCRVSRATLDNAIAGGSTTLVAANQETVGSAAMPIGSAKHGGTLLVCGYSYYPLTDNHDIDLTNGTDASHAYKFIHQGCIWGSGVYGGTAYAHAENVRAATANSSYLWSVETIGKLVRAMPDVMGFEHASKRTESLFL